MDIETKVSVLWHGVIETVKINKFDFVAYLMRLSMEVSELRYNPIPKHLEKQCYGQSYSNIARCEGKVSALPEI